MSDDPIYHGGRGRAATLRLLVGGVIGFGVLKVLSIVFALNPRNGSGPPAIVSAVLAGGMTVACLFATVKVLRART